MVSEHLTFYHAFYCVDVKLCNSLMSILTETEVFGLILVHPACTM